MYDPVTITVEKDVDAVLNTNGSSLWSDKAKPVRITKIWVESRWYEGEDDAWGTVKVYFNTDDWNYETDGLIYTDDMFEEDLVYFLSSIVPGFDGTDFGYSEQGMQGDDYVDFDIGGDSLAKLIKAFGG